MWKSFRLPVRRTDSLKERVVHPLTRDKYRELKVLRDISFEVRRGEFFGVAGRNGCGKSTLLKLLASVYRADRGRIRIAGLVAPIIELGVGFQPEMNARDNVVLNGVMMGLSPSEARRRFDSVIEFAQLEDFVELKLKNFSSGMTVRLAFAIVMQTNADVLLLDEVLAVGDAEFQRRAQESFEEIKRKRSKTVLLVTHVMPDIERYCDRAMLLEEGRIEQIGDPGETARRYSALSETGPRAFAPTPSRPEPAPDPIFGDAVDINGGTVGPDGARA